MKAKNIIIFMVTPVWAEGVIMFCTNSTFNTQIKGRGESGGKL